MNTFSEDGINLTAFEAEQIISGLQKFSLDQVGSLKWFNQHEALETLNIQAHKNSMAQNEEFVSEAILSFQKVETLIHDLVLIQTWKKLVYPKIQKDIIYESAVSSYFVLYHEATVMNLLQIVMYHPGACKEAGDAILDLLNAIKPKLALLITWKHQEKTEKLDMQSLLNQGPKESFENSIREMEFAMAMNALGLFRSITDCIKDLSLSALKNMLIEDDMVCVLVYLMENSPWIRKKADTMFEKFEGHQWVDVKEEDLVVITTLEAQVWLSLMNLLLESEARKTYQYCKKNQSIVLRLKDCITDQTVDQLPPLVDLQRYLEELLLMDPPEVIPSSFGIQPLSDIYASITDGVPIDEIAKAQNQMLKSLNETQKQAVAKKLSKVYNFENFNDVIGDAKCAKCGQAALQRCSRCQQEWYCSRPCQVKAWKTHKEICDIMAKAK